jgi:hypothetical protein
MKYAKKLQTMNDYNTWRQSDSWVTPNVAYLSGTKEVIFNRFVNNNGHDYIDLGLSSGTLWATMNIGASSVTDPGFYFAWGETEPKSSYTWENYAFGTEDNLTEYCYDENLGAFDKTRLDLEDDAAHVLWGGGWHIPTIYQLQELYEYFGSNISDITYSDNYMVFRNLLYIPEAGVMDDSSLSNDTYQFILQSADMSTNYNPNCFLGMSSTGVSNDNRGRNLFPRYLGTSIRPVIGGENYVHVLLPPSPIIPK